MEKTRKIDLIYKILGIIYLVLFFFSSLTLNRYHIYSHMADYSFGLIFSEILKLSCFLLIPLALFLKHETSKNILKTIFPLIAIASMFFVSEYSSINFETASIRNLNNLDNVTLEIYQNINSFMPPFLTKMMFISENIVIFATSAFLIYFEGLKSSDYKSLSYYPIYIIVTLPLNIFTEIVELLPSEAKNILTFNNFSVWHFLMFIILVVVTLLTYYILKKKSYEKQVFYLRAMSLVLFIHFLSKNSMLLGDGYNVYNTIFAAIPLFICDIGKFIVLFAVFSKKKVYYDIAYFVHAVGALSVFFYFGKDGTHNYGTIFNYSFLYFTITHLLLFMLSVLPVMLKHSTFKIKDAIVPSIYYACVILVATFVSVGITNLSGTWTTSSGDHLPSLLYPNYAFSQICPLPITLPTFMNFHIGICEVNLFYEIGLYIAYLCLFFAFFLFQLLVKFIVKKINLKKEANS